jgi:peptide deformylase
VDHDHDHGEVNDEQLDGEREVRRRMALTQIRQWPDPVLKLRAQEVVFVIRRGEEEEPVAAVNPRIIESGDELETNDEGCLSLQGVLIPVERPATVVLEAQDVTGAQVRLELEGLDARVVQHELDHLDGVLILERTTPEARREAMATLRPQPILG